MYRLSRLNKKTINLINDEEKCFDMMICAARVTLNYEEIKKKC